MWRSDYALTVNIHVVNQEDVRVKGRMSHRMHKRPRVPNDRYRNSTPKVPADLHRDRPVKVPKDVKRW